MQAFVQLFMKSTIPVSISIRTITSSIVACSYLSPYNRRTGRGHANDLMHRDLPRFIIANKKNFTRTIARLVGIDSGLERIVDVAPTFKVMDVYWLAKGDKSDEIMEKVLKNSEDFVRKRLSELLSSHNIPRLTFVAERKHLVEQEMNHLFEKADYGMQYRALSHTGAILGSMADAEIFMYEIFDEFYVCKRPHYTGNFAY
ncbi:unnamed protein product [Onchocerca ochengi]|uniref:Ribosome-binding factor A n=1 Tax=Onchocerca ochengi TaxID=42157 RepID=A0A182EI15_ONCOC|nr:unnamed protein product [Onchocerca ochengi]